MLAHLVVSRPRPYTLELRFIKEPTRDRIVLYMQTLCFVIPDFVMLCERWSMLSLMYVYMPNRLVLNYYHLEAVHFNLLQLRFQGEAILIRFKVTGTVRRLIFASPHNSAFQCAFAKMRQPLT